MTPDLSLRRVLLPLVVALAVVVTALALPSSSGTQRASLREVNEQLKAADGVPHVDPPGTPAHTHDPRFKNTLARGGETSAESSDPTTAAQARASAAYVASERALPDPRLTTVPARQERRAVPQDRYAMAGGCYTLSPAPGRYVRRVGDGVRIARVAAPLGSALPLPGDPPRHLPALRPRPRLPRRQRRRRPRRPPEPRRRVHRRPHRPGLHVPPARRSLPARSGLRADARLVGDAVRAAQRRPRA